MLENRKMVNAFQGKSGFRLRSLSSPAAARFHRWTLRGRSIRPSHALGASNRPVPHHKPSLRLVDAGPQPRPPTTRCARAHSVRGQSLRAGERPAARPAFQRSRRFAPATPAWRQCPGQMQLPLHPCRRQCAAATRPSRRTMHQGMSLLEGPAQKRPPMRLHRCPPPWRERGRWSGVRRRLPARNRGAPRRRRTPENRGGRTWCHPIAPAPQNLPLLLLPRKTAPP
ncbi:hypothetical protein B0H19DRAFT_1162300 [Mycena capillaripes]|nr:hypothetical protein B0H19DRAFT_1162300 [Mycena capillaripes]